jgi:hypothetical protein
MDRDVAAESLSQLHDAQQAFYAGGPAAPLRELLTNDVAWRVPGENAIAGVYTGIKRSWSTSLGDATLPPGPSGCSPRSFSSEVANTPPC